MKCNLCQDEWYVRVEYLGHEGASNHVQVCLLHKDTARDFARRIPYPYNETANITFTNLLEKVSRE